MNGRSRKLERKTDKLDRYRVTWGLGNEFYIRETGRERGGEGEVKYMVGCCWYIEILKNILHSATILHSLVSSTSFLIDAIGFCT